MKMLNIALLGCLLTSVNLVADDEQVLLDKMKDMRNGMVQIQDGFFYNKVDKIKKGVKLIEDANLIFKDIATTKRYLPKSKKHMGGMTLNSAKKINLELDDLSKAIKKNKFHEASRAYSNIVNNCTSCHATIRGW